MVERDPGCRSAASVAEVPRWVQGVWRRNCIRTDGRHRNDATVIWIQTPTLYADIRVPVAEGEPGAPRAEGFGGWLDVENQICRWQRPIDVNPGPEDVGVMFRDGANLIEVGLMANYLEDYALLDSADRCLAASRGDYTITGGGVRFAETGPMDILVNAGSFVTHACRVDDTCGLRHGRYDAVTQTVSFNLLVGDPAVFATSDGAWTLWTRAVEQSDRETLLKAAERDQPPGETT